MMDCKAALERDRRRHRGRDRLAAQEGPRQGRQEGRPRRCRGSGRGRSPRAIPRRRRRSELRDRLRGPQRAVPGASRARPPRSRSRETATVDALEGSALSRRRDHRQGSPAGAIATIGENMTLRRAAELEVAEGRHRAATSTMRSPTASARSACSWRSNRRRRDRAVDARPPDRHARRRHQPAGGRRLRPRSGGARSARERSCATRTPASRTNVIEKIVESGLKTYYKEVMPPRSVLRA